MIIAQVALPFLSPFPWGSALAHCSAANGVATGRAVAPPPGVVAGRGADATGSGFRPLLASPSVSLS